MRLAQELGVTSTPVLVLPDGEMVAGYRSADAIVKLLDE
jgi:predicted DsbA family dithiol-disulfide isomerase